MYQIGTKKSIVISVEMRNHNTSVVLIFITIDIVMLLVVIIIAHVYRQYDKIRGITFCCNLASMDGRNKLVIETKTIFR